MRRLVFSMAAMIIAAALSTSLLAQKVTPMGTGKGGSPHERVEWTIDGGNITIEYGRPSLKGRTPGKDIDPYPGKEWRTGADEQTTLITDKTLQFGLLSVPPGRYGIHTIPVGDTWQLIVSKREKGWGIPYPSGQDLGRVAMTASKAPKPAETLTIGIEDTKEGGTLWMDWGTTRASIPFVVR